MDFYNKIFKFLEQLENNLILWFKTYILDADFFFQVATFCLLAYALKKIQKKITPIEKALLTKNFFISFKQTINTSYAELFYFVLLPLITESISRIIDFFELQINVFSVLSPLVVAWSGIRFLQNIFDNSKVGRFISWMIWSVAALNIAGQAKAVTKILKSISLDIGAYKLTLFNIFESTIIFTLVFWITGLLLKFLIKQLHNSKKTSPSEKVLFTKVIKFSLYSIASLYALNIIGLDLTTITVFSGAIGFGLGFGLKQILSNFISGLILLLDKSIKPGDVIAYNDTFGKVTNMEARYVSVEALDGKKILIPNEFLVTNQVENWSFGNDYLCIGIPVGISYETDVWEVKEILLKVAQDHPEVLTDPEPSVLMRQFGDSTINLDLRAWIKDPSKGYARIKSDLMYAVWKAFLEHKITIPYPQRDIHIKSNQTSAVAS